MILSNHRSSNKYNIVQGINSRHNVPVHYKTSSESNAYFQNNNMRQVQPETLPKNSNFFSCLQISSLKITPPKTPNSGQFSYPLPNMVSFLFRLEFRLRSRDFSFNLFPVWQPYC